MNVKDAMLQDRTRRAEGNRKQLSRRAYGELVGISEQRIWGIERGYKLKAGELELLTPHLGDLLAQLDEAPAEPAPPQLEGQQKLPLDNRTQPQDYGADDRKAERQGLQAAYAYVLQRLHGQPESPYPWPSQFRIEACPPSDFDAIRTWIQATHEWLDGVREQNDNPQLPGSDRETSQPTARHIPRLSDPGPSAPVAEAELPAPELDVPELPETTTQPPAARPSPPPVDQSVQVAPLDDQYRYITNGELRTWARCRRQWWFGYHRQLGLKAVQVTGAASIGTRVHRVLAEYYVPVGVARRDPWEVFQETLDEDEKLLSEQGALEPKWEKWRKEVDLARAMIEGYFEWVEETAADAGLIITAPETRLTADARIEEMPNVRLLAKLDVRASRQPDGARLFLDHKTRADLVPKTLQLDEQMLHYHLTEYLHLLDEGLEGTMRTDGAIYNMLRKVKRTATANPPFYGRIEVRHNLDELKSYWMRVKEKVLEIERAKERLEAGEDPRAVCYPMPTAECSYQCDYFQLCSMYDDGSRAEDYVQALYVEVNPLRRYEPDKVGALG